MYNNHINTPESKDFWDKKFNFCVNICKSGILYNIIKVKV